MGRTPITSLPKGPTNLDHTHHAAERQSEAVSRHDGSNTGRKTRVLFTLPNLEGGGGERVFVTLLRHLDRERFELHLALVERKGVYITELPADVTLHDLGGRSPLAFLRLLRLIWRLQPDTVFATLTFHSTLVLLLQPLAPRGTRFVVRETCLPTVHVRRMPYGRLRWWLYAPAHRRADMVLCQTQEMADDVVRSGVPVAHTRVIPNPLDIAGIAALAGKSKGPFREGRHIVAAGRLVPAKGYDLLLSAFVRVAAKWPDVTLHLLGQGRDRPALERQARELDIREQVIFEGFQDNPFPYFRYADLFVLPSRYEGFPNVVLEVLSLGTPVVAFDCPGGSAVVEGENGWVVPCGDVAALGERLATALKGPSPDRSRVAASVADHDVYEVVPAVEKVLQRTCPGEAG